VRPARGSGGGGGGGGGAEAPAAPPAGGPPRLATLRLDVGGPLSGGAGWGWGGPGDGGGWMALPRPRGVRHLVVRGLSGQGGSVAAVAAARRAAALPRLERLTLQGPGAGDAAAAAALALARRPPPHGLRELDLLDGLVSEATLLAASRAGVAHGGSLRRLSVRPGAAGPERRDRGAGIGGGGDRGGDDPEVAETGGGARLSALAVSLTGALVGGGPGGLAVGTVGPTFEVPFFEGRVLDGLR